MVGSAQLDVTVGTHQSITPVVVDAGIAVAPLALPVVASMCDVDVTTAPPGADIMLDGATVLGTSPATIPMPCGVVQKVSVKKARYGAAVKAFTATATATKLAIKIPPPMLQLKVTSVPTGATITVGGKVVGITPTTVKVLGVGATTITVSKDGFAPDTQKIAPHQNNATHHVALKRVTKQG